MMIFISLLVIILIYENEDIVKLVFNLVLVVFIYFGNLLGYRNVMNILIFIIKLVLLL